MISMSEPLLPGHRSSRVPGLILLALGLLLLFLSCPSNVSQLVTAPSIPTVTHTTHVPVRWPAHSSLKAASHPSVAAEHPSWSRVADPNHPLLTDDATSVGFRNMGPSFITMSCLLSVAFLIFIPFRKSRSYIHVACFTTVKGRLPKSVLVIGGDTPVGQQLIPTLAENIPASEISILESPSPTDAQVPQGLTRVVSKQQLQLATSQADVVFWCTDPAAKEEANLEVVFNALSQPAAEKENAARLICYIDGTCPTVPDSISFTTLTPTASSKGVDPSMAAQALLSVLLDRPLPVDNTFVCSDTTAKSPEDTSVSRLFKLLILLTVPVAWGTYAPAVRYMYALPQPVPSLIFGTMYHVFAFATLAIPLLLEGKEAKQRNELTFQQTLQAGAELGGYKFLGNTALLFGLRLTTSGIASFIVQLSTVIIPVTEAFILRRPVPGPTWVACALSMAGVAVFAGDGLLSGGTPDLAALQGDALALITAVFFSLQVVRLGAWAPRSKATSLALSKVTFELLYNLFFIGVLLAFDNPIGQDMDKFINLVQAGGISGEAWQAILGAAVWIGGISCAYTIWAQALGQSTVRPVNANLIYASQPIWSTLFGVAILGETFGPSGYLAAALIASGVALSIVVQRQENAAKDPPSTSPQSSDV